MNNQIALPWDRGYMSFDRDKLETAILAYMTVTDAGENYPQSLLATSNILRDEYKWAKQDYTLYPVAARVALEMGIDP